MTAAVLGMTLPHCHSEERPSPHCHSEERTTKNLKFLPHSGSSRNIPSSAADIRFLTPFGMTVGEFGMICWVLFGMTLGDGLGITSWGTVR